MLYSFVPAPEMISPNFLGIFAIGSASIVLALVAAALQFVHGYYSFPIPEKSKNTGKESLQADFGRSMAIQMRFLLPVFVGIGAYVTSNAIALYLITSSVVGLAQEFYVRRKNATATSTDAS